MKNRPFTLFFPHSFLLILLLLSCTKPTTPEPRVVRPFTATELRLAQSAESFGLTLFRKISASEPGVNQFISPFSISMALGMALNGASTTTYDSMKACLGLADLSEDEINTNYKSLMDLLSGIDPKVTVEIANSVWHRSGFSVQTSFFDALTTWFGARVEGVDFASPSAAPTINEWVNGATHGRISEIVPNPIPDAAVLYLINAIYFKGTWTTQFDPAKSYDGMFTLPNGSKKSAHFMMMETEVLYGFFEGTTVLELSYGDDLYRMTLLMPSTETTIDAFAAGLTGSTWNNHVEATSRRSTIIAIPKFKLEYKRNLNNDLKGLGMAVAFDTGAADFSRINPTEDLFISNVLHKTFVQVDEEGTEAAAVTSVEVGVTSVPQSLVFDRPFIFAIREARSGVIVFIGKLVEPSW